MRIIMVEPERSPYEMELEDSLGAMQRCVGGTIEAVYEPGGRDAALICNDGRIKLGLQDRLVLGNMDSKRDWGYAPDYAEGMWRILQAQTPGEYVLATNETHTVREFTELAFARLGMEIEWVGKEENEKGICKKTGKILVEVNPRYYRPTEVDFLLGDPSKAKRELGWEPKTTFKRLVEIMTDADFKLAEREAALK